MKFKSATISDCQKYRYELRRIWDYSKKLVLFICLNPSTADSDVDDNTSNRCIKYAKNWNYGGLLMANLFAYRSTDSSALYKVSDPIGSENDDWIKKLQSEADLVVCAWGNQGVFKNRNKEVLEFINSPYCLVRLKTGHPGHPLYKPTDIKESQLLNLKSS